MNEPQSAKTPTVIKSKKTVIIFTIVIAASVIIFAAIDAIRTAPQIQPGPQSAETIPSAIKNPPLINDNTGQIYKGAPFKLSNDPNNYPEIFAKVEKLMPHPQNKNEYILYLTSSTEAAGLPFIVRPIYTDEKAIPLRETFIYFSRITDGQQKQIKAAPKDLIEGFPVIVMYKINEPNEIFAVTVAIQENLIK